MLFIKKTNLIEGKQPGEKQNVKRAQSKGNLSVDNTQDRRRGDRE